MIDAINAFLSWLGGITLSPLPSSAQFWLAWAGFDRVIGGFAGGMAAYVAILIPFKVWSLLRHFLRR